jgi:hypothetical protein
MAAPFVIWLALHIGASRFALDLHPLLPWLRRLQWVAWGTGAALFLLEIITRNIHILPFACACVSLNAGLSIADRHLKKQFAPELITNDGSANGWWPSKPNE